MKKILTKLTLIIILFISLSASGKENLVITIIRVSHNTESVTGELYVNGKFICHTLERPWQNNESYVSSIPQNTYSAHLRFDHKDRWRLELDNVPGRTYVQIHIGNTPKDIEGCVLVGETVINGENRLEGSINAYTKLKNAFYGSDDPNLSPNVDVLVRIVSYPLPTKYFNTTKTDIYSYEDKGNWNWGIKVEETGKMADTKLTEVKRDLEYIYFKPFNFRLPLNGGLKSSFWDNRWSNTTVSYKREN